MTMLQFPDPLKPKTKKIVFEDIYPARDSGTLEQLKELSSKRRLIEESINSSRFITEAIAREMSGGLTSHCEQDLLKLEQYLPLLENLIRLVNLTCDKPQMIQWTSNLKIRWSSALASSCFLNIKSTKFFQIDSLDFELVMILFLYGALVRERASQVLPADLVQSANLYRKAAGVYHHLVREVLPSLQPKLGMEWPPEATTSLSSVMNLICLAEAQSVTIRKAEEKGNTGGLLAKLHYGVAQLFDEAASFLHQVTKECKDVSVHLMGFLLSSKALHELRSYKYIAESQKSAGQIGVAIGVLHWALVNAKKNMPGEEAWRLAIKREINDISESLRKFEHENEFIWREKVPNHEELPVPEGVKIVTSIPYEAQKWERALVFKF